MAQHELRLPNAVAGQIEKAPIIWIKEVDQRCTMKFVIHRC